MAQESRHLINEADIGSGEKTPGQQDVERDEQAINTPLPQVGRPQDGSQLRQGVEEQEFVQQKTTLSDQQQTQHDQPTELPGRTLQDGDHIARVVAVKQPDETYEAQVYVRLTREPEVAETYIPAGIFGTEAEAWAAAEERARRAFKENEF